MLKLQGTRLVDVSPVSKLSEMEINRSINKHIHLIDIHTKIVKIQIKTFDRYI